MKYLPIFFLFFSIVWPKQCVFGQSLTELVESSNTVAVIDIVAGRVVADISRGCTTEYTAEIIDSWKGPEREQTISFRVNQSLLIGWSYLVFVSDKPKEVNSDSSREDKDRAENLGCPESAVSATVVRFGDDDIFDAIFELRISPNAGSDRVSRYYSGSAQLFSLLLPDVSSELVRVNRPYISEFQAIVDASAFENRIGTTIQQK